MVMICKVKGVPMATSVTFICMLLKEPVKAVHCYTETLCLSTDRNTKITRHHNRGCAKFDVAECIIQGKKPKELVPATTQVAG